MKGGGGAPPFDVIIQEYLAEVITKLKTICDKIVNKTTVIPSVAEGSLFFCCTGSFWEIPRRATLARNDILIFNYKKTAALQRSFVCN